MPPNIVLFVAALTVFLPLANLYPTSGADVLQYRSVDPAIPHDAQPLDTSTAPNLVTRDLTSLLDLSRALVPTQSFQLDHLGAPGDQTYYRILITFLDLLSTCTKLTRDKLIQWRLAESKDRNEQEFLKRLQSESPGRVVFPDTSIVNPGSGHGTLWTTGRKLPFFLPSVNANTVDIRR
ncbi:unnamed protein product [Bemisia tabaci]|uniref:Uncharacterized protein n=1 Tax=Bemisia tabaci TaxID=7038 RepID=A0A9P0F0D5_BEMTA|nr:unnamed protein product [Bemisia tabaci]